MASDSSCNEPVVCHLCAMPIDPGKGALECKDKDCDLFYCSRKACVRRVASVYAEHKIWSSKCTDPTEMKRMRERWQLQREKKDLQCVHCIASKTNKCYGCSKQAGLACPGEVEWKKDDVSTRKRKNVSFSENALEHHYLNPVVVIPEASQFRFFSKQSLDLSNARDEHHLICQVRRSSIKDDLLIKVEAARSLLFDSPTTFPTELSPLLVQIGLEFQKTAPEDHYQQSKSNVEGTSALQKGSCFSSLLYCPSKDIGGWIRQCRARDPKSLLCICVNSGNCHMLLLQYGTCITLKAGDLVCFRSEEQIMFCNFIDCSYMLANHVLTRKKIEASSSLSIREGVVVPNAVQ